MVLGVEGPSDHCYQHHKSRTGRKDDVLLILLKKLVLVFLIQNMTALGGALVLAVNEDGCSLFEGALVLTLIITSGF